MASRFSLESVLSLKDGVTNSLRGAQTSARNFSRNFRRSMSDLSVPIQNVNRQLNRGLRMAGTAAVGAVAAGAVLATREFIRFDEAVTQAGAKFVDLDVAAADYQDRLTEVGRAARQVGAETEFNATDAAGALDKMAMAGMSSVVSMRLLRGTTDLATSAGTDLTTAVDIVTDSLGAFGMATDDAAQAERNLNRISDVMVKTTTTANTNLTDLFESVRAGAPAFTAAGQSLATFSAFAGVMANAGVKGSESGTNLRNIMLRLAKPTGEAADVLDNLGVRTQDAEGNFRDAIDILADFEKGLAGMGTQQRSAALATVFGARAVTGVNILLQEGTENLRQYRGQLDESGGAAQTMAEAMRQSLGNRIKVLISSLTELGFKFVEAFEERGAATLERLTTAVQNFDPDPVIDFLTGAVEFGAGAFRVLSKIWPVLVGLGVAIKTLAFVTGTLNIALGLTPVGAILAGVTALTTGVILLIKHWDDLKEKMQALVEWWQGTAVGSFLNANRNMTIDDRRQRNQDVYGLSASNYAAPNTRVAESRSRSETIQRQEVYVRPDRGAQVSRTPGGVPESTLELGFQQ